MNAVVFAYHNMGLTGLEALKRHGFTIRAIFSHEDDPNENCWFGSVAAWAEARGIPLYTPDNVNTDRWIAMVADLKPDVIFSFYFRHLICPAILDIPRNGAFNLHGSLLPAYRGRVPVNWALINGEEKTGVTLHYMVKKADAGDMVGQRAVGIAFGDTAAALYGKLCAAAALLLDDVLPLILSGNTPRIPQDEAQATTFKGRRREDGLIDWQWPAMRIYNLIRAVTDPYPGAFTRLPEGEDMIVWWGLPEAEGGRNNHPGRVGVRDRDIRVGTGDGAIRLLEIEIAGRRYRQDEIYAYFKNREGIRLT